MFALTTLCFRHSAQGAEAPPSCKAGPALLRFFPFQATILRRTVLYYGMYTTDWDPGDRRSPIPRPIRADLI